MSPSRSGRRRRGMASGARPVHIPRRRFGRRARRHRRAQLELRITDRSHQVPDAELKFRALLSCTESPEQPLNHGLPVLEDATHVAVYPRHQERPLQETEVQPVTHDVGQARAGTASARTCGCGATRHTGRRAACRQTGTVDSTPRCACAIARGSHAAAGCRSAAFLRRPRPCCDGGHGNAGTRA